MDSERINQIIAFFAAIIAGIITYIKGGKSRSNSEVNINELTRLRDERDRQLDERDRQLMVSIKEIRSDLEMIVKAMKESVNERFREVGNSIDHISDRLHEVEKTMAVVEDRQRRPR